MSPVKQSIPEQNPESKSITIIRYPNRRLYDRSQGQYVTLQNIADLIRQGKMVTVQDSKSGEDLTRIVLTQILLDQHPERMELFPIPVLHMMIGANEMVLGFLRSYLEQSLNFVEMMQKQQPFHPLFAPLDWMKTMMPAFPFPGSSPGSPPTEEPSELARRVNNIERKLDELNKTLEPKAGEEPPDNPKSSRAKKNTRSK